MTFNMDAWMILFFIAFLMVTDIMTNSFEIATDPAGRREAGRSSPTRSRSSGTASACRAACRRASSTSGGTPTSTTSCSSSTTCRTASTRTCSRVAPNILFRRIEPTGKLQPIKDFENLERFGAGKIEDLTWKQMLDPYTCTECGRCEINCPAFLTGKELSPKKIMHDMRAAIEAEVHKISSPLFVWDALKPPSKNGNGAQAPSPANGQRQRTPTPPTSR